MSPGTPEGGADPMSMLTSYQNSAIIGTAVECGVANRLASGPADAATVARDCGLDLRATRALLGAMAALSLVSRSDDDTFSLTGTGEELVDGVDGSISQIVRKEWFFYRVWAELPSAMKDGHARIAPWRDRLRDDPDQALDFLRALDDLAKMFGSGMPELAGVSEPGRLLDVGGGAGSHSAYLAAAVEGLEPVVLDLPEVEPVLEERHPDLEFITGDMSDPRFGRPDGEQWDYVLLSNILHDNPPGECERIVAEAAGLLRRGGALLIYEWVIDEDRLNPPEVATFSVMMMVENEGGNTYTEADIADWCERAGLSQVSMKRGPGPIAALTAVKA
jgi:SAM-dependent methyltransferase